MKKLLMVLVFAAMLLILGLLVASVTSCSPDTATTTQPAPTIVGKGTYQYPYQLGPLPGTNADQWSVSIPSGHTTWAIDVLYGPMGFVQDGSVQLKAGQDVLYDGTEYRLTSIDYKMLSLTAVVENRDCCAASS